MAALWKTRRSPLLVAITIFRLHSLICEVKYKHRIENGKLFKDTDPQAKLAAVEALEDMAVPFIPLRACVGS